MDLNKSKEFFDPKKVTAPCYIIGCGSIGSNVAELLTRQGVENMILWDMDYVESHNIANQLYTEKHIGMRKTKALKDILTEINPKLKNTVQTNDTPYENETLGGFVFMCVDNIPTRQAIIEHNFYNRNIKAVFDFRTTLLEGQHYAADWNSPKAKRSLRNSLNFTDEDAEKNTPVSACGFELSVSPVVRMTAIQGIVNFTNYINGKEMKHIICEPYSFAYLAM